MVESRKIWLCVARAFLFPAASCGHLLSRSFNRGRERLNRLPKCAPFPSTGFPGNIRCPPIPWHFKNWSETKSSPGLCETCTAAHNGPRCGNR